MKNCNQTLVVSVVPPLRSADTNGTDHDANSTGVEAAERAAARWTAEGRMAQITMSSLEDFIARRVPAERGERDGGHARQGANEVAALSDGGGG